MRKLLVTVVAVLVSLIITAQAASADTCHNGSRPAPKGNQPTATGVWIWLPSIGVPEDAWGFASPGGNFDTLTSGNFGGSTGANSLLTNSATCDTSKTTSRQTTRGIQTGCDAPPP
jgi:hypothetical protein